VAVPDRDWSPTDAGIRSAARPLAHDEQAVGPARGPRGARDRFALGPDSREAAPRSQAAPQPQPTVSGRALRHRAGGHSPSSTGRRPVGQDESDIVDVGVDDRGVAGLGVVAEERLVDLDGEDGELGRVRRSRAFGEEVLVLLDEPRGSPHRIALVLVDLGREVEPPAAGSLSDQCLVVFLDLKPVAGKTRQS
jgi:hypothetical protein